MPGLAGPGGRGRARPPGPVVSAALYRCRTMTAVPARPRSRTVRRRSPPHRAARPRASGRARPPGGVRGVLRHLGAVQLDTISVLARSHELVPYARLGAVGRRRSRTRTGPAPRLRVLVARRLHPAHRGMAALRLPPPRLPRPPALAATSSRTARRHGRRSGCAPRARSPPRSWAARKNGGEWWDWSAQDRGRAR